jgi:hypothetical protein
MKNITVRSDWSVALRADRSVAVVVASIVPSIRFGDRARYPSLSSFAIFAGFRFGMPCQVCCSPLGNFYGGTLYDGSACPGKVSGLHMETSCGRVGVMREHGGSDGRKLL